MPARLWASGSSRQITSNDPSNSAVTLTNPVYYTEIVTSVDVSTSGALSRTTYPIVAVIAAHGMRHCGVLAPGNGKTKLGRLWTYVRDDRPAGDSTPPAVWFAYSSRAFSSVECFAAVVTPTYVEHAVSAKRPTWVFDEFQIALSASDELLQCVALWRSGDERPPFPFIIDLRGEDDAGVEQLLAKHLCYDGPKLDPGERARLFGCSEIRAGEATPRP